MGKLIGSGLACVPDKDPREVGGWRGGAREKYKRGISSSIDLQAAVFNNMLRRSRRANAAQQISL